MRTKRPGARTTFHGAMSWWQITSSRSRDPQQRPRRSRELGRSSPWREHLAALLVVAQRTRSALEADLLQVSQDCVYGARPRPGGTPHRITDAHGDANVAARQQLLATPVLHRPQRIGVPKGAAVTTLATSGSEHPVLGAVYIASRPVVGPSERRLSALQPGQSWRALQTQNKRTSNT